MSNKVYKKNTGTLSSIADRPASVCRAEASLYLGKTHCTHLAGPVCVAMYRLCCGQYHSTWPGLVLFPLNRNRTASTRTHKAKGPYPLAYSWMLRVHSDFVTNVVSRWVEKTHREDGSGSAGDSASERQHRRALTLRYKASGESTKQPPFHSDAFDRTNSTVRIEITRGADGVAGVTMDKKRKDGGVSARGCIGSATGLENWTGKKNDQKKKWNKKAFPSADRELWHEPTVASLMCSFDNWVDFLQIVEHL